MEPIGTAVFLIGLLSLLIGFVLLSLDITSRGSMNTQWGKFSGPTWFVFIGFGLVLMVTGAFSPI